MALAVVVVVALAVVTGCASIEPEAHSLPAGSELVATSGSAMRSVLSAHFSVDVHGRLAGASFRHAEGDVDARGTAQGSADVVRSGATVKVGFVLLKGVFYVKGPTGGYQKSAPAAAAELYDLTSMFNPNHGMARTVIGVNGATTRDKETVDGVECYRITGTVAAKDVAAALPGIGSDARVTVWLAVSGAHLLVRAELARGRHDDGTVDVSISDVNTPVSVAAPV
jgi:lipoprotein LprG